MNPLALAVTLLLAAIGSIEQASGQSSIDIVVDLYLLGDKELVKRYEGYGYNATEALANIEADARFAVNEANKYFSSLKNVSFYWDEEDKEDDFLTTRAPMNIDVRVFKMDIRDDLSIIKSSSAAVDDVRAWMAANKFHNDKNNFDFLILLTGSETMKWSAQARPHTVCTTNNAGAVVKFDGTQSSAFSLTKMIAFGLGVQTKYITREHCGPEYMMHENAPVDNAVHEFSTCSWERIQWNYNRMTKIHGTDCWTPMNAASPAADFKVADYYGRDVMNADKVCVRRLNDVNAKAVVNNGDARCKNIVCDGADKKTSLATEGMECDTGKRCNRGKCM